MMVNIFRIFLCVTVGILIVFIKSTTKIDAFRKYSNLENMKNILITILITLVCVNIYYSQNRSNNEIRQIDKYIKSLTLLIMFELL